MSAASAASSVGSGMRSIRGSVPDWVWMLVFLAVAIAYPAFVDADLLDASITTLAYVMMALGLNIVVGFAGLLDLGYVAFFAIGAYVMGWLGSSFFADVNGGEGIHVLANKFAENLPGIHLNFVLIVLIAAAFTGIWGALLGAPTLRLRGDYLAIVTLAFGEIVPRVFENLEGISNGRQGITPVDKVAFLPGQAPFKYPIELEPVYYVALGMVLIVLFLNRRLRDSRLGRAWIAVREDEVAASAMGIHLVRTKLWAYAIGAALGGFAGAFLATYQNTVNVDQFEFGISVFILCMVIIGGMGNIWGVVLGAVALSMVNRYALRELNGVPDSIGLDFDVTSINFGLFGFFLVVMMVLRPEGFIPSRRRRLELHEAEVLDEVGPPPGDTPLYEVRK